LQLAVVYENFCGAMKSMATSKIVAPALLTALLGCRSPAEAPPECGVLEVPADKSTVAPRPDETQATFHFPGNNPEQREFVLVHEDGSYDYAERWNFGMPKKGTVRSLDPRGKETFEDDLPMLGKNRKKEEVSHEGLQKDIPPSLEVDWDDELQATFGWDWKVGCRTHVSELPSGSACCHQHCEDGGATGTAYEPPDQFACMNSAAGGHYDWFLKGLYEGGMNELAACMPL